MNGRLLLANLLFILLPAMMEAQISPGALSKAHADLEGMSNCTQCHTIGQKVSNDKCLSCHTEIQTRMDQRSGYHASREVRDKDCASCHSDHHGRNFDMVHLNEDQFNHDLAGYPLEGAHKKIDCRECHQPDFIVEYDLKKRPETFLGLEQECISCHEDYHQKTLSNDCGKCHDTEAFAPAANFDHAKTDYPLLGKHQDVDCIECHRKEKRNGKDFQKFSAISFQNCNSCHQDAHENNLGTNCKQCHVEQSFTSLSGLRRFNHSRTEFPLLGKHQQVDCAACHNLVAPTPLDVFQDRKGVKTTACNTCHEDVHDGRFGLNCADCHNEQSFAVKGVPKNFNHNSTGFALEGKHQSVACIKCHKAGFLEPLPHNTCASCHADYHQGQFVSKQRTPDCAECHSVDGFETSLYTISDHNESQFPLEGAHAATPCFTCHQQKDKWVFRNLGERCIDCHDNVHGDEIDPKFYPNQACEQCHFSTSWKDNRFDHGLTSFQLVGAHSRQSCSACHIPDKASGERKFRDMNTTCTACHEDDHHEQFDRKGVTDCTRCHGNEQWKIDNFNHNKTAFKLEGKHAFVDCKGCHKVVEEAGAIFVKYKFKSFECVVCHH